MYFLLKQVFFVVCKVLSRGKRQSWIISVISMCAHFSAPAVAFNSQGQNHVNSDKAFYMVGNVICLKCNMEVPR